jgi:hypothetical protein
MLGQGTDEDRMTGIEPRSRDLAVRLDATAPETTAHHRQLRDQGDLIVRDLSQPYLVGFWAWQITPEEDGRGG